MPAGTETKPIHSATVRFAGDSGDGMQLAGMQFTDTSAVLGNDVATLPDYPAEIRAPAGTVAGVSGFQINFADSDIFTPGDRVNALIAMNPAALRANLADVEAGGIVVVDEDEFTKLNLRKANYGEAYNPLDDEQLQQQYKIYKVPISRLTADALADFGMGAKEVARSRNMYALGLVYYLYDRSLDVTIEFLNDFFGAKKQLPKVAEANIQVLKAGYHFGETAEIFPVRYQVAKASIPAGRYRRVTGNEAVGMGLITASKLAGKKLIYCGYPITPASEILHYLASMNHFGVETFQAEDEIAAICAAVGVAFAGQLAACGTSGPGMALKAEAIGLAVMTELPMVIVNVQRGGPSTGLPTKTEQADLLQALYGRNGECPLVVLAARSPADCFDVTIEAVRIALDTMAPVILLSDGYIANGAEPWRIPDPDSFEKIVVRHPTEADAERFEPYQRDEHLTRPWAIPGTPGLEHRIGGLEKQDVTGDVSYDSDNHQKMVDLRIRKVQALAERLPPLEVEGPDSGPLLVLGWGGTYGAISTAVHNLRQAGHPVAAAHLRYLNPFPANLGNVLQAYERVLIPELNTGQLRMLIRAHYLVNAKGLNQVRGQPFLVHEVEQAIERLLNDQWPDAEFIEASHEVMTAK